MQLKYKFDADRQPVNFNMIANTSKEIHIIIQFSKIQILPGDDTTSHPVTLQHGATLIIEVYHEL